MTQTVSRRNFLTGLGILGAGLLAGCSASANGAPAVRGIDRQFVWSTHPVGTGSYNDVAAIANAFTNQAGTQVRLLSSSTGIGRVGPIMTDIAQLGRTSVEYYYAFEAEDEFCSETWGPQPIRMLWPPEGNYGILVRKDSGVTKVEELENRRVPNVTGNPAVIRNIEALLSYGGLTFDDVKLVNVGYAEQAEALKTGHIDVMFENPTGTAVQELASEHPVQWLDFGSDDEKRFARWQDLVPMATTAPFSGGAGMEEGEEVVGMSYSIPFVTVEKTEDDMIYDFLTILNDTYDSYKDTTQDTKKFKAERLLLNPLVVPIHTGAIKFMKEHDMWTKELEARNEALLEREQLLLDMWPKFWEENKDDPNVNQLWKKLKAEELPELPEVSNA